MSRNWHYTLNRRLRSKGWDLRRYPDNSTIFPFIPEFLQLQTRVNESNTSDFARFINGLALIAGQGGKIQSQLGQEAFVVGNNLQTKECRYLEIGAYDPYIYSNTAVLRNHFG